MFSLSLADVPFVGSATPIQRALAVLRKFGTDAHIWLPGVGALNGLQTANYLLSDASTGLAPVDQYVGRANDALGGLGVELNPNPGPFEDTNRYSFYNGNLALSNGEIRLTATTENAQILLVTTGLVIGKAYRFTAKYRCGTAASCEFRLRSSAFATLFAASISTGAVVTAEVTYVATETSMPNILNTTGGIGTTAFLLGFSIREVTGIQATQPTTANKGQLKLVGNSYRWVFDATDNLACTIPAGWEAATTIDANPTGQVTLQNQNIVGTYLIGPNLTTSGRIILKTAPSASDLMLLQNLANRLAGL